VTKIVVAKELGQIFTASLDAKIGILSMGQKKIVGKPLEGHLKPIYSLDWCERNKILASCGREKEV
jgi:hypothetical protein